MSTPRTYTCEGCGDTFTGTPEEAFDLGWDTPERFMSYCTCPKCPIDTTLWWKIVIEHQPITAEEGALLVAYNQIYTDNLAQASDDS